MATEFVEPLGVMADIAGLAGAGAIGEAERGERVAGADAARALVSRRNFLRGAAGAAAAFMGIVMGVPVVGYLGGALKGKIQAQWVKLGRVEQFTGPDPQPVQFALTRQDGWVEVPEAHSCWVVPNGDSLAVFNGRCTHLGCAYSWRHDGEHAEHFFCPCHEGVYDRSGKVVGGPPPRGLDQLETRTQDGDLMVLYVDFRPGTSDRVPL